MWQAANSDYLLGSLGALLILIEFIRPGGVLAGVAGALLVCWSGYELWHCGPTRIGCALLVVAAGLFATEAIANIPLVAGILGIAACGFGGTLLLRGDEIVLPSVSWASALVVGTAVLILSYAARQARVNKQADL